MWKNKFRQKAYGVIYLIQNGINDFAMLQTKSLFFILKRKKDRKTERERERRSKREREREKKKKERQKKERQNVRARIIL